MDLRIREIEKKDVNSVFELLKLYGDFNNFKLDCYTSFDLLKEVASKDSFVKLYVADLKDEIIGFILFNQSFDLTGRSIFIEDNFVIEKYRGKKIGSSLFAKVLEYALSSKIEKIRWSLKERDNKFRKLYSEMGAVFLDDVIAYKLTKKQLIALSEKEVTFNSDLFKIREVNNRDLPEIKYFIDEERKKNKRDIDVNIYDLMKYSLGENRLFKMLLLEVNEDIVGLMTYFDYFSAFYGNASHIQCTYVKNEYKNIGIDRILNTYLINKIAKDKNILTIDIDKEDDEAKKRMQFFEANLIENNTVVEMDNKTLNKLINLE